ncbi:iron hydrogenase small subunit [Desulfovibrio piger]|uniref:Periplasmic [Fe] hydrogenase small subunit n=1 Tax=Desulfovibrio piger TaxID=901 RepID=A0A1K1LEW0_9BACT|nr:iron hydrogenase small subunit [Desulfovibrio piger]SFV73226.1 Periplasmic [Fe] hydrogenase small subunit [Desulfovibrio piger]
MKMTHLTRRGFLRAACAVAGGAMISLRMAGVAVARFRDIRDYMLDRINGVYGADAAFPVRASQDNAQVRELYAAYLKQPLGPLSEKLLHTRWTDRSAGYRRLVEAGTFPNPRDVEMFAASPYPYEQKF